MPKYKARKLEQLAKLNRRFVKVCENLMATTSFCNKTLLAKVLDIKQNVLTNIINGKRNVTIDQIINICKRFKVNPAYLLPLREKKMYHQK